MGVFGSETTKNQLFIINLCQKIFLPLFVDFSILPQCKQTVDISVSLHWKQILFTYFLHPIMSRNSWANKKFLTGPNLQNDSTGLC